MIEIDPSSIDLTCPISPFKSQEGLEQVGRLSDQWRGNIDLERIALMLLLSAQKCLEQCNLSQLCSIPILKMKELNPKEENPSAHDRAQRLFYLMFERAPASLRELPNIGERAFSDAELHISPYLKQEAIEVLLNEIEKDSRIFDADTQAKRLLELVNECLECPSLSPLLPRIIDQLKRISPKTQDPQAHDRADRLFYIMFENLPESFKELPNIGEKAFLDSGLAISLESKKRAVDAVLREIERDTELRQAKKLQSELVQTSRYQIDPSICDEAKGIFALPSTTCNPLKPGCQLDRKKRIIELGTVYDHTKDPLRDHYAGLANMLNQKYAQKWGIKNFSIQNAKKFIEKQCLDPVTKIAKDCELYWTKVYPFVEACEQSELKPFPKDTEVWKIVLDTDVLTLRDDISPHDVIDRLRSNPDGTFHDASLILPMDSHPWPSHYMHHHIVKEENQPNTGIIIGRIDARSCHVYRKWWESRDSIPDRFHPDCRSLGICSGQENGLHEQQGIAKVTTDHPCLLDRIVTVVPVRDPFSRARSDIVINSVYGHDKYCLVKCDHLKNCHPPYSFPETPDSPSVYRYGDLWTQPNVFPTLGKKMHRVEGVCPPPAEIDKQPIEEVRLEVMKEACSHSTQSAACRRYLSLKDLVGKNRLHESQASRSNLKKLKSDL